MNNFEMLKLEIGKLELKEGNLLVVNVKSQINNAQIHTIRKNMEALVVPGVKIAVFCGNVELFVLKQDER